MWSQPPTQPPYERAEAEDIDESDAVTLADEELAVREDELMMDDPLNKKLPSRHASNTSKWTTFIYRRRNHRSPSDVGKEEVHAADQRALMGSRILSSLLFCLPSWSHGFFGYLMPEEPHRSTDYLDGLRGVASLFVFFDHYLMGGMDDLPSFSFGEGNHWNLLQLPFIRTVYSGGAMVAIFYVISGYVLSARSLVAMRIGDQDKVHSILTSMTFRRAFRLFLPSLAISILSLISVIIRIHYQHPPHHWTIMVELRHFVQYLNDYLFSIWSWQDVIQVFGTDAWHGWYGGQLWTIPIEFNCSIVLFMVLTAVARCQTRVRFIVVALLLPYLLYIGRWDVATFIAGMGIAELDIIKGERDLPRPVRLCLWVILISGWYLTGFSQLDQAHTPGYSWLSWWWLDAELVKWRFWLAVAGTMVVGSLAFLPTAQRAFTTPVARYLGRISYALYLVHGLLNATLRFVFWRAFSVIEHPGQHDNPITIRWVIATILYFPFVFWAADVFWRLVDIPSVRFAKWIEKKSFVSL